MNFKERLRNQFQKRLAQIGTIDDAGSEGISAILEVVGMLTAVEGIENTVGPMWSISC